MRALSARRMEDWSTVVTPTIMVTFHMVVCTMEEGGKKELRGVKGRILTLPQEGAKRVPPEYIHTDFSQQPCEICS